MGGVAELAADEIFAGRYEIQRLLGEGDRKRTYLARDKKMDRLVAISLVKPAAVLSDPRGTEREAKVLGRIGSHPNIVSLHEYEVGRDGSVDYMIFEHLGGGTLTAYLQTSDRQSLGDILRFGRQLCRGLSHLHRHGLIHRDVSPDNIWLDERCVAHLGDFDSAIPISGADVLRPITTGSFAAPEELEGRPLDVRSDLFSLGGVLHVIATSEYRPGDPGKLRSQRPDLPSALGDLVASLQSRAPNDRPADAEDVLRRLDEIRNMSDIVALITAGEGEKIEFKSSLHHPYGPVPPAPAKLDLQTGQPKKEIKKLLAKSVTKTIAAFLNSDGGTLLIGVDDSGTVLGIEPDFAYLRPEKRTADGWLLSLQQVIINALGPEVWNAVHISLVRHGSLTVAVAHCPARTTETWHTEDDGELFYIRAANGTRDLNGSSLLKYIREHWPS